MKEVCRFCNSEQAASFKFCSQCGRRNTQLQEKDEKTENKYRRNLQYLSVYTLFSIILLLVEALTDTTFEILVIWTVLFALIDIIFAVVQPGIWHKVFPKSLRPELILLMILIGIVTAVVVSYSVSHINRILFEEVYVYMPMFEDTQYPLPFAILIVAVCPALFEELAFRGFVFNNIEVIAGRKSAILGSAFLFGLVHFSLISLFWIIPFGLMLAYFRSKYSSMFYGMLIHFTHNASIILLEYYGYF